MNTSFNLRDAAKQLIFLLVIVGLLNLGSSFILAGQVSDYNQRLEKLSQINNDAHKLLLNVSQIQQFLTDVSATGDSDGFKDAQENFQSANKALDDIEKLDPQYKEVIADTREKLGKFLETGREMANVYSQKGREAGNVIMKRPTTGFDARADELSADLDKLVKPVDAKFIATQEQVKSKIQQLRWLAVLINFLSVAGFAYMFVRIGKQLTSYLGGEPSELHGTARRIASGDLNFSLQLAQGDRNSVLAQMEAMRGELKNAADHAAEALRVKIALDNVSTGAMIADNDRSIVYINKAVEKMLKVAEADIRKMLPNFNPEKLIGVSIDTFHKNPAHQRNMLSTFTSNYKTQIKISGRTFALSANPVINDKGERMGSVVEWTDRTHEVAVENEVAEIVQAASQGDLTKRIDLTGKEGFFKTLSEGINQMVTATEQVINDTVYALDRISNGDMTERIEGQYEGSYGVIKDNANLTIERLTEIVSNIKEAADAINTAAKEIAAGNTDLSQRTEEQASSLEETASSMEELASTVKQNAENAKQANQMAAAASSVAVKGGNVVGQVVKTMSDINDSSRKIVDIISVIDGIAFQTNILALNAAVEAARAGEQGRGFAVVASEVRNLAQRSAAAAKEIKQLISDSVTKVEGGTRQVQEAGSTMNEIVSSVKRVTDIMAEITAASVEQSSGIDQVNQAVTQMDEVTQQNAALVEEAAAAAETLEEQAQSLIESISIFQLPAGAGNAVFSKHAFARLPAPSGNVDADDED